MNNTPDPRERDALASQTLDPASGQSDDPRVDPTPRAHPGDEHATGEPATQDA